MAAVRASFFGVVDHRHVLLLVGLAQMQRRLEVVLGDQRDPDAVNQVARAVARRVPTMTARKNSNSWSLRMTRCQVRLSEALAGRDSLLRGSGSQV
jgi:hypothetical protein